MYIHGMGIAFGIIAPDFVHQLTTGEDLHGAGTELEQEEEFLLGQGQQRVAPADGQAVVVQHGFSDGQAVAGHGLTSDVSTLFFQEWTHVKMSR